MRPVIQLHTIEQWEATDPSVRSVVLQNIKLRDRLWAWRRQVEERRDGPGIAEPTWVPCPVCNAKNGTSAEHRGWVLKEPRYPGIHPSQLPHPCLLRIWNEMNGVPTQQKHEAKTLFIFDIGHAVHHMLQTYGQKGAWGERYTPEAKINGETSPVAEELYLEGSMDADNILVIDDIPNAPIFEVGVVHEYKTINPDAYKKLTRPKPEHRQQAMIYSKCQNRPVVVFLYVNKGNCDMTDYPVAFDRAVWSTVEDKARTLLQFFDAGQRPPADVGFHCNQCQYAFDCPERRAQESQRMTARR